MYILSAILLLLNVFIIALLLRKKNDHATAELSSLREDIGRLEKSYGKSAAIYWKTIPKQPARTAKSLRNR